MIKNQKDVDVLVNLTNLFSSLSAARVNWQKSEALAVGKWCEGLPVLPKNLSWKRDGLKYRAGRSSVGRCGQLHIQAGEQLGIGCCTVFN